MSRCRAGLMEGCKGAVEGFGREVEQGGAHKTPGVGGCLREASDLAVVAQEDPAAFWVQGSKLLEAAQLTVGQGCIQLGVQGLGVVPGRPAGMTCCMMRLQHDMAAV